MLYLGCHLSSSKGYAAMGRTALSIGANTFQFFTRNPRGGAAKSADPADAAVLVQMQQDGQLGRVVAHAPYTLNPCSKDERTREFAREVFESDLQRMELTPGNFYNFHPGSHVGQGVEAGIELIAACLDAVVRPEQHTTVLLETMSGREARSAAGSRSCARFLTPAGAGSCSACASIRAMCRTRDTTL